MTAMTDHIPVIETGRLRLRAPKLDDLPALTAFFATERSKLVGGPLDATDVNRAMMSIIGTWALRGHGFWHIADKASDRYLGATGILYAPGWDEPELGWNLIEEAEGRGIAFEAAQAARAYSASHLGRDAPISYIDPANTRSIALALRLGATFEREGELLGTPCHVYRHPSLCGVAA